MGWNEEIFVIREGMPIAYVDYKGYIMITKLMNHGIIKNFTDYLAVTITGEEFKRILQELEESKKRTIEDYIIDTFKDSELVSTDNVYITGL